MPLIHHFAGSQSLKILGPGPADPWSPVALEPGNVSKKGRTDHQETQNFNQQNSGQHTEILIKWGCLKNVVFLLKNTPNSSKLIKSDDHPKKYLGWFFPKNVPKFSDPKQNRSKISGGRGRGGGKSPKVVVRLRAVLASPSRTSRRSHGPL